MSKKQKTAGAIIGGVALGALATITAVATAHDMKQEKKAKREIHKHQDLVEQKKQYIEHGKIEHFNPTIEQNIAFLGFHNKYLSAYKNGTFALKSEKIGESEIFTSVPIEKGNKIGIKPYNTNTFICCNLKNNKNLKLNPHCKEWEHWIVEKDNDCVSFKSAFNTYLCAEKNGKPIADRKKKGDWEKWRIIVIQDPSKYVVQEKMVENDGSYY